jgi:hypothetical protein
MGAEQSSLAGYSSVEGGETDKLDALIQKKDQGVACFRELYLNDDPVLIRHHRLYSCSGGDHPAQQHLLEAAQGLEPCAAAAAAA